RRLRRQRMRDNGRSACRGRRNGGNSRAMDGKRIAPLALIPLALLLAVSRAPAAEQDAHAGHDIAVAAPGGLTPQLAVHGFSDITSALDRAPRGGAGDSTSSGFALGQFDFFFASRLESNLSFLGESVFELGPDGETGVDVERIFIKYTRS